jgi:hypothetical protein
MARESARQIMPSFAFKSGAKPFCHPGVFGVIASASYFAGCGGLEDQKEVAEAQP